MMSVDRANPEVTATGFKPALLTHTGLAVRDDDVSFQYLICLILRPPTRQTKPFKKTWLTIAMSQWLGVSWKHSRKVCVGAAAFSFAALVGSLAFLAVM